MKYRVTIIALNSCGCDAEGEVIAELEDRSIIHFYYQGSDSQAKQIFEVGKSIEVELKGEDCKIEEFHSNSSENITFPNKNCYFIATGELLSKDVLDDEVLFLLQSSFQLHFDSLFDNLEVPLGACVKVTGELWADNWWP
ncbi:hypothetical protein [Pseudoalteromonas aurantia]|uniref:Uncharacterized protein n=1 Tax=Pseudoalteromonas aurantia TaxID=43654 RepID=A0A5S3VA22_9GAMM|nr:hypothetical protein [Pseudoalteromonas aurantia]TMO68592.1 hypothetical protein CWC19_08940 [Pseudoalteromonas aurantia]